MEHEFVKKFNFELKNHITLKKRLNITLEEYNEYIKAINDNNIYEYVDALIDVAYASNVTLCMMSSFYASIKCNGVIPYESIKPAICNHAFFRNFTTHAITNCYDNIKNNVLVFRSLSLISSMARECVLLSGFDYETLYADVHRANMAKELGPSKNGRSEGMDVIKPEGWIGPRTKELVDNAIERFNKNNEKN